MALTNATNMLHINEATEKANDLLIVPTILILKCMFRYFTCNTLLVESLRQIVIVHRCQSHLYTPTQYAFHKKYFC